MEYAQLNESLSEAYQIPQYTDIEWDKSHFCTPAALTAEEALLFRVVPLLATEPPEVDLITQKVVRNGCEYVNDTWQYRWDVIELFNTQQERDAAIAANIEAKYQATIPKYVTMRQARLALLAAGLLETVDMAVNNSGEAAKIEWEYAQEVQRTSGLIPEMAAALGMTNLQIDALFIAASKL